MITLKVDASQLWLMITGLELLYDEDLTREHFDKTDLDDCIKESDDIRDLIDYLRSCVLVPKGGEG